MNFEQGKLYKIKQYFWLLYPTKEIALSSNVGEGWVGNKTGIPIAANHWSKEFGCHVTFVSEGKLIQVIENDGECVRVIGTEGIGWICVQHTNWTKDCFERIG